MKDPTKKGEQILKGLLNSQGGDDLEKFQGPLEK